MQWKQALVTSIYKSGSKAEPSNYRPISLTCLCCKIMEHIVLSHMAKHLKTNNILISEQHGFRECLSTVTQLINSTNDWSETLNQKGQNRCSSSRLLKKLLTKYHIVICRQNLTIMVFKTTPWAGLIAFWTIANKPSQLMVHIQVGSA